MEHNWRQSAPGGAMNKWIMIHVSALRRGLATNSSSTHSMIHSPEIDGLEIPSQLIKLMEGTYDFSEHRDVIVHTPLRKRRYLAAMLISDRYRLYPDIPTEMVLEHVATCCGLPQEPGLIDAEMGDMSGGALTGPFGREIPADPVMGPGQEWLAWALQQCDNPQVLLCDYNLAIQLGLV